MKDRIIRTVLRTLFLVLGTALGAALTNIVIYFMDITNPSMLEGKFIKPILILIFCTSGLILGYFTYKYLSPRFKNISDRVEKRWENMNSKQVISSSFGLLIGLYIAMLITQLLHFIKDSIFSLIISVILYILFGYIGMILGFRKSNDFFIPIKTNFLEKTTKKDNLSASIENNNLNNAKILDTSVLIDGRIADIAKTGFVEGMLVIPEGTLIELQHISDSSEAIRRNKGRRGLDIVAKMQEELGTKIIIDSTKYEDLIEVDAQLVKLAKDIKASIITNDYNLNKLAAISGVKVLNINDLANAVKPMLLQNEQIQVQIVREGKEPGQGIAYMADGTMIVVDNGKNYINETVTVTVTSVLQSSAGRMIFAKIS